MLCASMPERRRLLACVLANAGSLLLVVGQAGEVTAKVLSAIADESGETNVHDAFTSGNMDRQIHSDENTVKHTGQTRKIESQLSEA